ncbi:NUDIX family hydrolase [Burkholderia pseudomallei]|nr:NUDIX family hydrolase [Burkholderia pseudomallei]CAJ8374127.1 NUDIX family hydrolase [Burkholderia pseudomallei]CAJ8984526.1 NUDIX family hydrolase [Burkholderia pseudomallei]CAJ9559761.1 NUDIX family hydrolase [Burkholderia pseudomallei]
MSDVIATKDRVRIKQVEVLSDNWYVLRKTTFEFLRRDGTWQSQSRETYDRGNGATILLYSRAKKTVILTRQFRLPAFVNEHDGMLIETCAGRCHVSGVCSQGAGARPACFMRQTDSG